MKPKDSQSASQHWGKQLVFSRLFKNAAALMVSSVGTAALGMVFWGTATRLVSPQQIGKASAEIAAMSLLASMSQLGFGSTFQRFLPMAGKGSRSLVVRGYQLCVSVSLAMAIAYVSLGFARKFIPPTFADRSLFVLAVAGWTIFLLQDTVLISLRESRWVPVENILFSVAKLGLIPVFIAIALSQAIFLAWICPVVVAIVGVNLYLFRSRIPAHEAIEVAAGQLPPMRRIAALAMGQYVTAILNILSTSVVALIVIAELGPEASAFYYLPAIIATALSQLLWNVVTSFLVEASTDPHAIKDQIRIVTRSMVLILVPGVAIGVIFAPQILSIFGSTYAAHGVTLLRMLFLALLGTVVTEFYSSLAWLDKRVWWLAGRELASLIIYLGVLLLFIHRFGINATGIAALTSSGLQAIFFLPNSIRRYRQITRAD